MYSKEVLAKARDLLEGVTPLLTDCGRLCAHACCQGEQADENGMLLFPGEEAFYETASWARVTPLPYDLGGKRARLFTCAGACPRENRPLACRLFPLFCRAEADRFSVCLDARAHALCPLYAYGLKGLSQAFIQAGQDAYALLFADEGYRAYLIDLFRACSL